MSEVAPGGSADAPDELGDGCEDSPLPDGPELLHLHNELSTRYAENERAARVHQDAAIYRILSTDGFEGARYERFAERLMTNGWLTMRKMTENGTIFRRAQALGRPVPAGVVTYEWTEADRISLSTDSVLAGMQVFHDHALVRGLWRPEGGAGLFTYFVGASIRCFPRLYIRWFDDRARGRRELERDASSDEADHFAAIEDRGAVDPASAAATRDHLERTIALIPDQKVREGLAWRSLGFSQAQAAELADLTPKALERRLSRARVKVRNAQASWTDEHEGGIAR